MASICDRSPCDRLLKAIGRYMFGVTDGRFTLEVHTTDGPETAHIEYCPFCGTRLDEVGPGLLPKIFPKTKTKRAS